MSLKVDAIEAYSAPAYRRRLSLAHRRNPIFLFPSIRSDDPAFRRLSYTLMQRLDKEAPRSVVKDGFLQAPGCPGSWERLLNVAGIGMNPAGSPTGQQAADVVQRWRSPRDERIFRALVRVLYAEADSHDFSSKRDSSTMHPFYTKDPQVKLKSFMSGLSVLGKHLLPALKANKPERLASEHDFWICHGKASRAQPDGATLEQGHWKPKEREVFDFYGKRVVADKALSLPGVDVPHFAMRERVAYGTSASANYTLIVPAACLRHASYRRFPKTLHHGAAEDIQAALDARFSYVLPIDVKFFDQNQGRHLISAFIDELPLSEELATLLRLVSRAPVGIGNDYAGETGYRWVGNPLDFSTYDLSHGNPSGWAFNDLLNAAVGLFLCLLIADSVGAISLNGDDAALRQEIEKVLTWKHENFAVQNKGDDNVLWFARESHYRPAYARLVKGETTYLKAVLEDGAKFLGNTYVRTGGDLAILPDITSYVMRLFTAEYGWGSAKRPYPAHGYFQRQRYYASHPLFESVTRIVNEEFAKVYGQSLDDYLSRFVVAPQGMELLNYAEAEMMVNPAAIHYKVDVDDIRPELQEKFFVHVPWKDFSDVIKAHFTIQVNEATQ